MVCKFDRYSGKPKVACTRSFACKWSLWQWSGPVLVLTLSWPIASFSAPTPASESSQSKNILVLYALSDPRLFAPVESLKSEVRERVRTPVNFFVEYMETQRLEAPGYEESLSESF